MNDRPARLMFAFRRFAWLLGLASVAASTAIARAQPAPASQPRVSRREAIAAAREWVARPRLERRIVAFAPAADIRYREYDRPRPLRTWIVRIDLDTPGVRFALTRPDVSSAASQPAHETLSATTLDFAMQRGVQLAVNTSAFGPFRPRMGQPMDVVGLAAVAGRKFSEPHERFGALYISRAGRVALKGPPLPQRDLWHVVAGFRMLVDDRHVVVSDRVMRSKFGGVNPRTAVGSDREGRTLWIVVVDGRQQGVSEGITLIELACLMESLGVWDALNLDGGGSSTLVVEDRDGVHRVMNTPVGRGKPGTLREVANNLGFYLPGVGIEPRHAAPRTLREAVVRLVSSRRGGGYEWKGDGVARDICYEGQVVLRANPRGTFCCGATLEAFLQAYCWRKFGKPTPPTEGRWFEGWPPARFVALWKGWYGTDDAPKLAAFPPAMRSVIRERQVAAVLPWAGLGQPVNDYRLLRRGDFVEFWRKNGSGHSVIFWGRDVDEAGRERLWYWSSQRHPRYAYPRRAGGSPVRLAGYGLNWEYVGSRIDPARIFGAAPVDSVPVRDEAE